MNISVVKKHKDTRTGYAVVSSLGRVEEVLLEEGKELIGTCETCEFWPGDNQSCDQLTDILIHEYSGFDIELMNGDYDISLNLIPPKTFKCGAWEEKKND